MRAVVNLGVVLALAAGAATTPTAGRCAPMTAPARQLQPGDPAPPFSLPGSDGRTHSLSDSKGKVVVLAWFAKAFTGG